MITRMIITRMTRMTMKMSTGMPMIEEVVKVITPNNHPVTLSLFSQQP